MSNLAIKYTRKDSKQMAVFNLATRSHSYEMIMFPDPYAKEGSRLEDGKLALIQGLVGRRNGEMSLAAHNVFDLETSIPKIIQRINFILYPNNKAADFIELLRETIDGQYGETRVNISFLVDEQILEAETAQSLTFNITQTQFQATPPPPRPRRRPHRSRRHPTHRRPPPLAKGPARQLTCRIPSMIEALQSRIARLEKHIEEQDAEIKA